MRLWFTILVLLLGMATGSVRANTLDRLSPHPADWKGHLFKGSYAYPRKVPDEKHPWLSINFRSDPRRYLNSLLAYALEGQDLRHWDVAANKVRRWYHVPWLGPGPNGREYIHGLTRGRDFAPRELSPRQSDCRQNWVMAFYNGTGGALLGRIWSDSRSGPDFRYLPFLLNTVAVKLVFTEATEADDPALKDAPRLQVAIHDSSERNESGCPTARAADGQSAHRTPSWLRLVQFDVAVREQRASYKTGWVFGSFRYDGAIEERDWWNRLKPIGLMWGNDPQLADSLTDEGMRPRQSIVFEGAVAASLGRGGRMNGPADDRASACSSCHMAAQWPSVAPMLAPTDWTEAKCWFRNVDGRYPFGWPPGPAHKCGDADALEKIAPLDFSLQLTIGARNWAMDKLRNADRVITRAGVLTRDGQGRVLVDGIPALSLK
ncbi:MAG: hypothetical protein ABL973_02880 [Micropepsaceae bacterium]